MYIHLFYRLLLRRYHTKIFTKGYQVIQFYAIGNFYETRKEFYE